MDAGTGVRYGGDLLAQLGAVSTAPGVAKVGALLVGLQELGAVDTAPAFVLW
jgi:hypothetical protein